MSSKKALRIGLVCLLLASYVALSYRGSDSPLLALTGSILIIVLGRLIWPAGWKERLGLKARLPDILFGMILTPLLMALFYVAIRAITGSQGILYQAPLPRYGWFSPAYLHTLGQTLNEELMLGALTLYAFKQRFNRLHPLWIAALVAAGFSLLHYVFYGWIVLPKYSGILTPGALLVLFAIGLLRNALILKTNHILYAWSLHLSINLVGLLGRYRGEDGRLLREPEIFNLLLGSQGLVLLAVFVIAVCVIALAWKSRREITI